MHRQRFRAVVRPTFCCTALTLIAVLILPAGSGVAAEATAGASDPHAVQLAGRLMEALGGDEAWAATRFLRFDFFGVRLHHWDRFTGRHRIEGKTRDGDSYLVLDNLNDHQGRVFVNGEEVTGDKQAQWLQNAYAAWVNDTYWLLMPYKLRDPGVTLHDAGKKEIDGVDYDVVRLTFDSVGLTPGDEYWAYLNPKTGLMDRWAYHLESWEADRAPTGWWWREWQKVGGIMLSSLRVAEDGSERRLGQLAVFDRLPDSVFTSPEAVSTE